MTMPRSVEITDINGAMVARYLVIAEGEEFFGGVVHSSYMTDMGPHVWHYLGSFLRMLAEIIRTSAADKPLPWQYRISGATTRAGYHSVQLHPVMDADHLAGILGCTADQVREHYRNIVTPAEAPADASS